MMIVSKRCLIFSIDVLNIQIIIFTIHYGITANSPQVLSAVPFDFKLKDSPRRLKFKG